MVTRVQFNHIYSVASKSGSNGYTLSADLAGTSIYLYAKDPVAFPTYSGSFSGNGSTNTVYLEFVSGGVTTGPVAAEILTRIHTHIFPERGARISIADLGDAFPECSNFAEAYDTGQADKINHAFEIFFGTDRNKTRRRVR